MRYEDTVRKICGDDWNSNIDEYHGGVGVACVAAFIKGVKPNLSDMSSNLGVPVSDLYIPFTRLYHHGVFTRWNVKQDKSLLGQNGEQAAQLAWCDIAGVAGGLKGVVNIDRG